MPIDASIYSNLKPLDIGGAVERGLKMSELIDLRRARQQELEKQKQLQEAMRAGVVQGEDGTVTYNPQLSSQALLKGGFIDEAQKVQQLADQTRKSQLDSSFQELDYVTRLIQGVETPQQYAAAVADAERRGIDVGEFKTMSFQDFMAIKPALLGRALSVKDRMEAQLKQQELELKRRELDANNPFLGKAPPGYRFKPDGSLEPIPGGPEAGKEQARKQAVTTYSGISVQDANRALDMLKNKSFVAGPVAGQAVNIPGTPAWQLDQMLQSVKANASFDRLQAMRNASPTGGALGQVSDREMALLQSSLGTLDVRQPKEQLEQNIKRVVNIMNDIIHGPGEGPARYELSFNESGRRGSRNTFQPKSRGTKSNEPRTNATQFVRVQAPNGSVKLIPPDQVDRAIAAGGRVLDRTTAAR